MPLTSCRTSSAPAMRADAFGDEGNADASAPFARPLRTQDIMLLCARDIKAGRTFEPFDSGRLSENEKSKTRGEKLALGSLTAVLRFCGARVVRLSSRQQATHERSTRRPQRICAVAFVRSPPPPRFSPRASERARAARNAQPFDPGGRARFRRPFYVLARGTRPFVFRILSGATEQSILRRRAFLFFFFFIVFGPCPGE